MASTYLTVPQPGLCSVAAMMSKCTRKVHVNTYYVDLKQVPIVLFMVVPRILVIWLTLPYTDSPPLGIFGDIAYAQMCKVLKAG